MDENCKQRRAMVGTPDSDAPSCAPFPASSPEACILIVHGLHCQHRGVDQNELDQAPRNFGTVFVVDSRSLLTGVCTCGDTA